MTFLTAKKDCCIYMYVDETTVYTIGSNVDQVISSLNGLMAQISNFFWSYLNKLFKTIYPSKTEAMIPRKQEFVGPTLPIHFGDGYVKLVDTSTCLEVTIDNKISLMHT